jgi:hypothetical protein
MTNSETQSNDDSLWQAFLYMQGEMSTVDAEAFEQKMLHNTELCACKKNTPAVPDRSAGRTTGLRSLAVITAGCCCAALVILIAGRSANLPGMTADSTDGTEASLLVAAWIDTADADDELYDDDSDSSVESDLEVPEWMLAGILEPDSVSHESSNTPQQNGVSQELL